jgi:hypothetical protein
MTIFLLIELRLGISSGICKHFVKYYFLVKNNSYDNEKNKEILYMYDE